MAYHPERAGRPRAFLKSVTLALCAGLALGFTQIAPALGADGPWVSAARLTLTLGLIGVLYAIWRSLGSIWAAIAIGLITGLCYFGVALHWLGSSANPDPNSFIFREVVLTAGALCLFVPWWAIWFGSAKAITRNVSDPVSSLVAFVLCFSVANIMLGDLAFGMPMAPLSLVALDTLLARPLSWVGQFGVDTVLVLSGALLGALATTNLPRALLALSVIGIAALVTPLPSQQETIPDNNDDLIYLAQPSLPHVSMMDPNRVLEIVHGEVFRQVRSGVDAGASLVVLPEGAVLDDLTSNAELVTQIANLLPPETVVLTGFGRVEVINHAIGFTVLPYNSSMLIGQDGMLGVFDKAHLVPFGETMPSIFFALGFDVVAGPAGGYGSAENITVIGQEQGAWATPFALLICYEAMLSGAVSRETEGARWLLNMSSETLFRGTVGPKIILDHVRMRAIETGLPVLRSTAHAFSGIINPSGHAVTVLQEEQHGGVTVSVPAPAPTLFRSTGYIPLYILLACLALSLPFRKYRPQDRTLASAR